MNQWGNQPKYGNRKVTVGGETFDSQREYDRWCQLLLMQKAGLIKDLRRQVKYVLIPSQKKTARPLKRNAPIGRISSIRRKSV